MRHSIFFKEDKFKTMFFTLKMLALFFCIIPYIQYAFGGLSQLQLIEDKTLINSSTVLCLLLVLAFIMMFMDNENENKYIFIFEIAIFFVLCTMSIYFSGFITSYYKFVYIFMIVLYTIEFGKKVGIYISAFASGVLMVTDLVIYGNSNVNKYFENDLALCTMFIMVAWALGYYVEKADMHINMLSNYANIDGLTGVYNHRYFHDTLKINCERSKEQGKPLVLFILDIDYFKIYNDIYGHQQGDILLKEFVEQMKKILGPAYTVCRYGGDEFTVILYNTAKDQAMKIADNLRQKIADFVFPGEEHLPSGRVTITIGVAEFEPEKDTHTSLIKRADAALYRAKYLRRDSIQEYATVFEELNSDELDHQLKEKLNSLKTLITIINTRDSYTYNHTDRVVMLCMVVADYIGISKLEKRNLCYAAYVHDLGKININKEILISDKKLTPEEWEDLKRHPDDSAELISKLDGFEDIVPIVKHHHERYDGTGYPDRIKGENIEYLARILSVADSFDAMTNNRPYQPTKSYQEAFAEIERCSGTQFDPQIAPLFIKAVKEKYRGKINDPSI